jgi:hypothetical protein
MEISRWRGGFTAAATGVVVVFVTAMEGAGEDSKVPVGRHGIRPLPVYGEPAFVVGWTLRPARGTHLDAPSHRANRNRPKSNGDEPRVARSATTSPITLQNLNP